MKFAIIEVGSNNTKAYKYKNDSLINLGSRYIAFKSNYKKVGHLLESDIEELYDFIHSIKKEV